MSYEELIPPMRLRCVLLIMLAFAVYSPVAGEDLGATPQLLMNGGFEDGTGEQAADWGLWPPAGKHENVSSLRDATVKHAGEYSGRLRVTNPDFDGISTWHHNAVPVTPGQEIVLSFWIKAEGVTGICGSDVQLRSGPQTLVGSRATPELTGTFDWKQIVHRFVVPDGVDHICVVPLLRGGTGTVWFDDIVAYGTPTLTPTRLTGDLSIDGRLSEACWAEEKSVGGFTVADGSGPPERETKVWAACDEERLYLAFWCEKKPGDETLKTLTRRDDPVWEDDEVEVFLNLAGDRGDYYQFIVNALGTRYDSHRMDPSWSIEWQAAAQDAPDAWTVEMAIPVAELPVDFRVGDNWCANFGRGDKTGGQASSWSCTFGGFHNAGRLGTLANLGFDLVPFYADDARASVAELRAAFAAAMVGLETEAAPRSITAPVTDRVPRIEAALQAMEEALKAPDALPKAYWDGFEAQVDGLTGDLGELKSAGLRLQAFNEWRQGDTEPGFGLAVASPMEKVFKDAEGFSGEVTRELKLSAAGNEYEGAPVVLVSLRDEDIPDCRVQVTSLRGQAGDEIAAENLTLSVVGYVKTGKPGYETIRVGEWPDPLLPNAPFTLKAGQVQPVWLRAYVPPGTPPGDYAGELRVTGGEDTLTMAVQLHVFGFDLPRRQHLATPFGCDPGDVAQWYTADKDYTKTLSPDVFTRWNEFMLDYRLTPTRVGQSYIAETTGDDGRTQFDYSITDECIAQVADRLPLKGVNMASVGNFGWRAINGSGLEYVEEGAHSGTRAGLAKWPKTDSWASLSRPLAGRVLAGKQAKAFRFWVRAASAEFEDERIVAFVNCFPNRWITTFMVGSTEWHEVRIPLEQYRHNTTGVPLTLDDLATVGDFQFVIDKKEQPIRFFVDDLVAECEGEDFVVDDFELTSEFSEIQASVVAHLNHWKQKGWFELGHVYGWDEARPDEYTPVTAAYQKVLDQAPDAPIMQTYYTNRTPDALTDTVRIWCALTANYDPEFCAQRRAEGDDTWLYVCCGPKPAHANFFIDQPGVDHRILFWQTWQQECSGFLYWRVNYWHGMFPTEPGTQQWPDKTWNLEDLATYKEFKVNGDGWLIYPWHDWTPLSSVRLENVRDGIEDYEYLCLLKELAPNHPLLKVGPDISRDFTHYCKDGRVLHERRRLLAAAIETARSQ